MINYRIYVVYIAILWYIHSHLILSGGFMKVIFIYCLLFVYTYSTNITIGTISPYQSDTDLEQINQGTKEVSDILAFEMNLINLIVKELEKDGDTVVIKHIEIGNRENSLIKGVVDMVISSYSIESKRLIELDFTTPYFENKGLSLIVRNDSDIIDISDITNASNVGYMRDTTSEKYIENKPWQKKYIGSILTAIEEIKNNKLDAYIGDFIELQYYARIDKNLKILNIIPNKHKDYYAIAVKKDNTLKNRLNEILFENMVKINILKNKWIDDSLYSYNQLNKINPIIKQLKFTILILGLISIVGFIMILLGIYFVTHNKQSLKSLQQNLDEQIDTLNNQQTDMVKIQENTSKMIQLIKVDILNRDGIIEAGIDIFKTAKKEIYYIGSAGFSAINKEWLETLNKFIVNENTRLIRIVDLPRDGTKYFKDEEDYIHYLVWLIQRAAALDKYPTQLRLYTTRRAPLWSKGYIRIFKDKQSVLVFTGSRKSGNLIIDNVDDFLQTAQEMKSGAKELKKQSILNDYFQYSQKTENKKAILDNLIIHIQDNFDIFDETYLETQIRLFLST